ncbi:MAG: HAD superfamily hydrolase (TIGR01459 family) [Ascidiaceihabitans sp.]|jgi:HAD superfamily hydrolase (TIGR01459 family)
MTRLLDSISQIAGQFDAIVLDQWGVLHDGTTPYDGAIDALQRLVSQGSRLAVLSNSGKRSDLNAQRIAAKGFATDLFGCVMTSGEALWRDAASGKLSGRRAFVVSANPLDAEQWADGLDLLFVTDLAQADFVLIMGLPEGDAAAKPKALRDLCDSIVARNIPTYCSNPDRTSPRAGGRLVVSPGALAHDIADSGGGVTFYGKPHGPVFRAVETAMNVAPNRCLMVGDSLEHDIAGAANAGWQTLFIRGGIHAGDFQSNDIAIALNKLVTSKGTATPNFSLQSLR